MKFSAIAGSAAASLSLLAGATAALAAPPAFMPQGAPVAAPAGYADLCQRDVSSCGGPLDALAAPSSDAAAGLATSSVGGRRLTFASNGYAPLTASVEDDDAPVVTVEVLQAFQPHAEVALVSTAEALNAALRPVAARPTLVAAAADGAPRLTKDQMRLINTINRQVNREVQKADDFDLYGMIEYWSLPRVINGKMYGDCEDYALEKRRRLIEAGVPAAALSMAVAVTARGESHAVLVVAFEQGDWVLDNLTPWATPWGELNYHWIQRQVAGSSAWTTIS